MRLEWDVWHGDHTDLEILDNPGPDDVDRALRRLDQRRYTELALHGSGGQYLAVGGGLGCYHVYVASVEHEDSVVLQSSIAKSGFEELISGGRLLRLPARSVVGLAEATRAAQAFLRVDRPDPTLSWATG
jgi:hypothetical protein